MQSRGSLTCLSLSLSPLIFFLCLRSPTTARTCVLNILCFSYPFAVDSVEECRVHSGLVAPWISNRQRKCRFCEKTVPPGVSGAESQEAEGRALRHRSASHLSPAADQNSPRQRGHQSSRTQAGVDGGGRTWGAVTSRRYSGCTNPPTRAERPMKV
ncbi:uncharacterized protein B0H64DRAFT_28686 [Chaetomium fimeti]|uniref:Secreted protein n=1 Tax=Chaetomium fimeti TaxID=1854472 RepID=A0AAE0HR74_9PEZI|nr:hypothetical protein B0H64DRAFT_28686 [Chaetomium fimeti]